MRRHISLLLVIAAIACFAALGIWVAVAKAPSTGWFGNVYLGGGSQEFDAAKVLVVSYRITAAAARVTDVTLAYGSPSPLSAGGDAYTVELIDADGRTMATQALPDPRHAIVERQGNITLESGLLSVRFGFQRAGTKVLLRDGRGNALVEADLAGAIDAFCERNSDDRDCRAIAALRGQRS